MESFESFLDECSSSSVRVFKCLSVRVVVFEYTSSGAVE